MFNESMVESRYQVVKPPISQGQPGVENLKSSVEQLVNLSSGIVFAANEYFYSGQYMNISSIQLLKPLLNNIDTKFSNRLFRFTDALSNLDAGERVFTFKDEGCITRADIAKKYHLYILHEFQTTDVINALLASIK